MNENAAQIIELQKQIKALQRENIRLHDSSRPVCLFGTWFVPIDDNGV